MRSQRELDYVFGEDRKTQTLIGADSVGEGCLERRGIPNLGFLFKESREACKTQWAQQENRGHGAPMIGFLHNFPNVCGTKNPGQLLVEGA